MGRTELCKRSNWLFDVKYLAESELHYGQLQNCDSGYDILLYWAS